MLEFARNKTSLKILALSFYYANVHAEASFTASMYQAPSKDGSSSSLLLNCKWNSFEEIHKSLLWISHNASNVMSLVILRLICMRLKKQKERIKQHRKLPGRTIPNESRITPMIRFPLWPAWVPFRTKSHLIPGLHCTSPSQTGTAPAVGEGAPPQTGHSAPSCSASSLVTIPNVC